MPFHADVQWVSVGMSMAMSFAFWWVAGYFLGGDKYAPAIIGMTITGLRGAIAGTDAVGQLPDSLGVVSAKGWMPSYSRGGDTGGGFGAETAASAAVSAIVTFIFWIVAGYFVISGSAWKYATTAAIIAAVGGVVANY